jgi:hypothetical protein
MAVIDKEVGVALLFAVGFGVAGCGTAPSEGLQGSWTILAWEQSATGPPRNTGVLTGTNNYDHGGSIRFDGSAFQSQRFYCQPGCSKVVEGDFTLDGQRIIFAVPALSGPNWEVTYRLTDDRLVFTSAVDSVLGFGCIALPSCDQEEVQYSRDR